MTIWLLVIILAYLFFALSAFGDKVILSGPPNPKSYTFYTGFLNILVIFLIPFFGLKIPNLGIFLWIIFDAGIYALALYKGYVAVENFEISKVATTIGATQPILIFFISWFFWGYQIMSLGNFFAFILLLVGSVLISIEKRPDLTGKFLKATLLASLLFSIDYVLLKFIFSEFSFVQGFIWTRIFVGLFVSLLLFKKENRQAIFKKKDVQNKKLRKTFFATQACGGTANILQSYAIFLSPVAFLPIINSLKGLQYVFLFLITSFFSFFFPKILKEKISKTAMRQKITSIILIIAGLIILIF